MRIENDTESFGLRKKSIFFSVNQICELINKSLHGIIFAGRLGHNADDSSVGSPLEQLS